MASPDGVGTTPRLSFLRRKSTLIMLAVVVVAGVAVGSVLARWEKGPDRMYAAISSTQSGFVTCYDLSLTPGGRGIELGHSTHGGGYWASGDSRLPTFGLSEPRSDFWVNRVLASIFGMTHGETIYTATGETVEVDGVTWFVYQRDN